jgi:hypothetical protein
MTVIVQQSAPRECAAGGRPLDRYRMGPQSAGGTMRRCECENQQIRNEIRAVDLELRAGEAVV